MSDNTQINTGTGGDIIRTVDRVNAKTQVMALDFGGEAGQESLVTLLNPLPVLSVDQTNFFSSVANLAPGGSYLTGWIDTGMPQGGSFGISLSLQADQPIQFAYQCSPDGGTTVRTVDQDTVAANTVFSETHVAFARYVQFTFTNTGSAATTSTYFSVCQRDALATEAIKLTDKSGNYLAFVGGMMPVSDSGGSFTVDTGTPGTPLAVINQTILGATTQDAPLFTAITGDPSGDFAGLNLLEAVMDDNSGLGLNVKATILNAPRVDVNGALMGSDAPAQIKGSATATGQTLFVVDTLGYQSISIQSGQTAFVGTMSFQGTNDNPPLPTSNWTSIAGWGAPSALTSTTGITTVNSVVSVPCLGRFFRLQCTAYTSGTLTATAYLRQQPAYNTASNPSVNLSSINGTTNPGQGTASLAAQAFLPVGGFDQQNTYRRLALLNPGTNPQNVNAIPVQDVTLFEGKSNVEILALILRELQIANQQRTDAFNLDDPDSYRQDPNFMQ